MESPEKKTVGRPRKFSHPVKYTISLGEELLSRMDRWAKRNGETRSSTTRMALEKLLRRPKK